MDRYRRLLCRKIFCVYQSLLTLWRWNKVDISYLFGLTSELNDWYFVTRWWNVCRMFSFFFWSTVFCLVDGSMTEFEGRCCFVLGAIHLFHTRNQKHQIPPPKIGHHLWTSPWPLAMAELDWRYIIKVKISINRRSSRSARAQLCHKTSEKRRYILMALWRKLYVNKKK